MPRLVAVLISLCIAVPVWADARITVLMDLMKIDEVIDILHNEGVAYGNVLNTEMLDGAGGPVWEEQVRNLYDRDRMQSGLRQAFSDGLDESDIAEARTFFSSEAGIEIVTSENQTRRILNNPGIETAARELVTQTRRDNPEVYALVSEFIEVNELIDNNVSGSMNQQFHFMKGLSDGGYGTRPDTAILEDIWSMQDQIRADTEDWLFNYLVLAYVSLPFDNLQAYLAFSESDAGRALNAALFAGFDAIYKDISYGLGRAVALNAKTDEI